MNENVSNNKNGTVKTKRKFNVVDFFIVVIIIVLIAILIYSFSPWAQIKKILTGSEVTVDYEVIIREVDADMIDQIQKNDEVINSITKTSLGKVTKIESVEESVILKYDGSEEGKFVKYPDKFDITVRITAKADYEKGVGYSVNGCRIAVGEEVFFRFPKFTASGYCIELAEKS